MASTIKECQANAGKVFQLTADSSVTTEIAKMDGRSLALYDDLGTVYLGSNIPDDLLVEDRQYTVLQGMPQSMEAVLRSILAKQQEQKGIQRQHDAQLQRQEQLHSQHRADTETLGEVYVIKQAADLLLHALLDAS